MLHSYLPALLVCAVLAQAPAPATQSPAVASGGLVVDKNHSSVVFHVPILNGMSKVHGKFTDFDVAINYDKADVSKSTVTAKIATTSINTGIEARDKDLRGPGFFDVEKFPNITFESKKVEKQGDHLLASGTLTMHGVAHEVALPITITGEETSPTDGRKTFGFMTVMSLDRRDYGITWEHNLVKNFVSDTIEVEIELLARTPKTK